MTSLQKLILKHRDAILSLAAKHGMTNVRLFGSVARGNDTQQSDIDLLVTPMEGRSLDDRCGFWLDVQELLQHDVDVVNERGLYPSIRQTILQDAKPL